MATKAIKKNTNKEVAVALSAHTRSSVLLKPRITEKASERAMNANVYVFDVDPRTTKFQIKKAVQELYKVTPIKIAVVTIPAKQVFVRGKYGQSKGGKKAYIYLKKGDTIEFV